jgi:hypothetical protein
VSPGFENDRGRRLPQPGNGSIAGNRPVPERFEFVPSIAVPPPRIPTSSGSISNPRVETRTELPERVSDGRPGRLRGGYQSHSDLGLRFEIALLDASAFVDDAPPAGADAMRHRLFNDIEQKFTAASENAIGHTPHTAVSSPNRRASLLGITVLSLLYYGGIRDSFCAGWRPTETRSNSWCRWSRRVGDGRLSVTPIPSIVFAPAFRFGGPPLGVELRVVGASLSISPP